MELMYPFTISVTLLALLVYHWTAFNAGMARGKYDVEAPATDGPLEYRKRYRAHINTLEQMASFLPAMWLFAILVSDVWAAGIGVAWCVGRVAYAFGYYAEAGKRMPGLLVSFLATMSLIFGSIISVIWSHV